MGQICNESGATNTAEHRKSQAMEKENVQDAEEIQAENSDDAEQRRMAREADRTLRTERKVTQWKKTYYWICETKWGQILGWNSI